VAEVSKEPTGGVPWIDRDITEFTDEELEAFIAYWHEQGDGYRQQRQAVAVDHPDASRLGQSGWWCSKQESMGLQEAKRRKRERRKQSAPTKPSTSPSGVPDRGAR